MAKYTVVGVYPDELHSLGADGASYVEWVEAEEPEQAANKAQNMLEERREGAIVVAIFGGHRIDRLFNKGLNTSGLEICTVCGESVPEVIGAPDGAEVCKACFDAGKH